jgi:hypothetical protein
MKVEILSILWRSIDYLSEQIALEFGFYRSQNGHSNGVLDISRLPALEAPARMKMFKLTDFNETVSSYFTKCVPTGLHQSVERPLIGQMCNASFHSLEQSSDRLTELRFICAPSLVFTRSGIIRLLLVREAERAVFLKFHVPLSKRVDQFFKIASPEPHCSRKFLLKLFTEASCFNMPIIHV